MVPSQLTDSIQDLDGVLAALHRGDGPQLRLHPQPDRRLHGDPPHLHLPAPLLHEAGGRQHHQQGVDPEVRYLYRYQLSM